MIKYLATFAAASAVAASAMPAAAQGSYDWTGFYVGGNMGVSWGNASIDSQVRAGPGSVVIPPGDVTRINQTGIDDDDNSGFTGGLQAGYNYQMGNILVGIETDIGAFDMGRSSTRTFQSTVNVTPPITPAPPVPTYTLDQDIDSGWLWTLRPRLGYVSGPWLFYATGGIASTDIKQKIAYSDTRTPPNSAEVSDSHSKTGWVLGIGGAYMFSPNWSVRGEWLYADFGHVTDTVTTPNGFATLESRANVDANLVRVGVDYKF